MKRTHALLTLLLVFPLGCATGDLSTVRATGTTDLERHTTDVQTRYEQAIALSGKARRLRAWRLCAPSWVWINPGIRGISNGWAT